jgi:hypothetical protein
LYKQATVLHYTYIANLVCNLTLLQMPRHVIWAAFVILSRITHAEFGKENGRMIRVKMGGGGTALRTISICFSCAVMCVFKS